jgi:hypothetical protein
MHRSKLPGPVLGLLVKKNGRTEMFASVENLVQLDQPLNQQDMRP